MAIRDFLETHDVFTRAELMEICGDTQANANLLMRAKKAGKVVSVGQGVYVSNVGAHTPWSVNPYTVAEKLAGKMVFAYGTALSLFAGSHDVVYVISYFAGTKAKTTLFNGYEFRQFPMPKQMEDAVYVMPSGRKRVGTSVEQTLADCMAHLERSGGLEAVLRVMTNVEAVDQEALLALALNSSKTTAARLGWLMDCMRQEWGAKPDTLEALKAYAGRGPHFFTPTAERRADCWDNKWRLYFPDTVENVMRWYE